MKKLLVVIIVLVSFALPMIAWSYTVVDQKPSTHTISLREPITLIVNGAPTAVIVLQVSSIVFSQNQNLVAVETTLPEYKGKVIYIPIWNIKVIISNN